MSEQFETNEIGSDRLHCAIARWLAAVATGSSSPASTSVGHRMSSRSSSRSSPGRSPSTQCVATAGSERRGPTRRRVRQSPACTAACRPGCTQRGLGQARRSRTGARSPRPRHLRDARTSSPWLLRRKVAHHRTIEADGSARRRPRRRRCEITCGPASAAREPHLATRSACGSGPRLHRRSRLRLHRVPPARGVRRRRRQPPSPTSLD